MTGPDRDRPEPALRLATEADGPAIDDLMKACTREIFPAFYDPQVTASSLIHIAHLDPMLIGADVQKAGLALLMATLPGYEFYLRYGFREVERVLNVMPDGVALELVRLEMWIS